MLQSRLARPKSTLSSLANNEVQHPVTNLPDHPAPVHPVRSALEPIGGDKAPFVYFDRAFACGIVQGAVQVELGAHTIVPASGGTATRDEFIVAAHLRCTPSAAQDLMRALERALNMLKQRPEGVAN
jgi:hypothetical protein